MASKKEYGESKKEKGRAKSSTHPAHPQDYAGSGGCGPCLTDAAQQLLPANRSWCHRYAKVRTDTLAVIAALIPGGIMHTSRDADFRNAAAR